MLHVDGLPPPQLSSGTLYGLQLGVSLYDEAVGQCYGSTCYSMVEPLQQQQQQLTDAEGSSSAFLDFAFDALFHTAISDPHCMAVVSGGGGVSSFYGVCFDAAAVRAAHVQA